MALKSVIDIDVNSEKFQAFYDIFQQYEKRVGSLPESWGKVNQTTGKGTEAFSALAGETAKSLRHAADMVTQLGKATLAQKQFNESARSSGKTLSTMAKDAKSLAGEIFGIGKFLGKMSVLGFGAASLGLFGLDALGRSTVGAQRTARGLGLNQGQVKAFDTDFGRYVDPSMLGKVANAQNDFTGRVYLGMASGLSQDKVAGMGADQLSIMLAKKAHDWWVNTPEAMRTSQNLTATGFTQSGFSMEDMRRLGNTPASDLNNAASQYSRDSKSLDVNDKQVSEWYSLTRQLKLAGQTIETVLINKLAQLAPTLGALTENLTKDLGAFLNSALTPENINKFANGLKDAAEYLGSKDFIQKVKDFGDAIVGVTDIINGILHFGHKVTHSEGLQRLAPVLAAKVILNALSKKGRDDHATAEVLAKGGITPDGHTAVGKIRHPASTPIPAPTPAPLVNAIIKAESNGNPYAVSPKGAQGLMQLMPAMQKVLGVKDPFNADQSKAGGTALLKELNTHYKGDLQKVAAGYNMGQTKLDAVLKNHRGDDWLNYTPSETQKYVHKVVVNVNNNSSSKVDVQVAANR